MNKLLIALLGLAVLTAASAQNPAPVKIDPAKLAEGELKVIVLPPRREPVWDTVTVDSGTDAMLLRVPEGKRFVLTDLWNFSSQDYRNQRASADDRFWMEDVLDRSRKVVFDLLAYELPHHEEGDVFHAAPVHWETGVVFGPGHEVWVDYRFHGDKHQDWQRQVHFSGYIEDVPKN